MDLLAYLVHFFKLNWYLYFVNPSILNIQLHLIVLKNYDCIILLPEKSTIIYLPHFL